MNNLIGQHLGQYELTAVLGKGGMATVYRAHQSSIDRDVAVKVIRSDLADTPDFIKRFEREAKTIASLSHPHIVKVFDYGQHDDMVYLVMELLKGGNLADVIRATPLDTFKAMRLLDQIASALDYAHQSGIIHRDLKPQNVLLDNAQNAILTDFGIAKIMSETTSLTQQGAAMGTPSYMPPEQWQGKALDTRADVYSLGIMLFEMLTGKLPFTADTPYSMMHMHTDEPPPSILVFRSDLPPAVEAVLRKTLSKEPKDRYASAGQVAEAFRAAAVVEAPHKTALEDAIPTIQTKAAIPKAVQPTLMDASSASAPTKSKSPTTPNAPAETIQRPPQSKSYLVGFAFGAAGIVVVVVLGIIVYLLLGAHPQSSASLPTATVAQAAAVSTTASPDLATSQTSGPTGPVAIAATAVPSATPTLAFTEIPVATLTLVPVVASNPTLLQPPTAAPIVGNAVTATDAATGLTTDPAFVSNLTGWKLASTSGTWVINSDGLTGSSDGDTYYLAASNYSDFTYTADFVIKSGSSKASAGVVFRSADDIIKGSYLVRISVFNGGQINIVRFFPTKRYTQLALANPPIAFNTPYKLTVVVVQSTITVSLNDKQVLQASDSSFSGGEVGLNVFGGTAAFQDANVVPEPAGPASPQAQ